GRSTGSRESILMTARMPPADAPTTMTSRAIRSELSEASMRGDHTDPMRLESRLLTGGNVEQISGTLICELDCRWEPWAHPGTLSCCDGWKALRIASMTLVASRKGGSGTMQRTGRAWRVSKNVVSSRTNSAGRWWCG